MAFVPELTRRDSSSSMSSMSSIITTQSKPFFDVDWMADDASKKCMECGRQFSFTVRRHHCRACGRLVCKACSPHRMVLTPDSKRAVRVCVDCKINSLPSNIPHIQISQKPSGKIGGNRPASLSPGVNSSLAFPGNRQAGMPSEMRNAIQRRAQRMSSTFTNDYTGNTSPEIGPSSRASKISRVGTATPSPTRAKRQESWSYGNIPNRLSRTLSAPGLEGITEAGSSVSRSHTADSVKTNQPSRHPPPSKPLPKKSEISVPSPSDGDSGRSRAASLPPDKPLPNVGHTSTLEPGAQVAQSVVLNQRNERTEKRSKVLDEIVESESLYLNYIKALHNNFIAPILNMKLQTFENNPQVSIFTRVLEQIIVTNGDFFSEIQECIKSEAKVPHVFVKYSKLFTIYSQYARSYGMFSDLVHQEVEDNSTFADFVDECTAKPDNNNQALFSLLIMPVQRIPRYILFLETLAKKTKPGDPGANALKDATSEMKVTALGINEAIRKHDGLKEVADLEKQFRGEPNLVGPNRFLVHSGVMNKLNRRGGHDQYMFHLFTDIITYSQQLQSGFKLHRKLDLANMKVVKTSAKTDAFTLESASKSFTVFVETPEAKKIWLEKIEQTLKDHLESSASDGGQVVAPVWHQDDSATVCSQCGVSFSTFNRRHHCRRCGSLVCGTCSQQRAVISQIDSSNAVRVCDNCFKALEDEKVQASLSHASQTGPLDRRLVSSWCLADITLAEKDFDPVAANCMKPVHRAAYLILVEEKLFREHLDTMVFNIVRPFMAQFSKGSKKFKEISKGATGLIQMCTNVEHLHDLSTRLCVNLESCVAEATQDGVNPNVGLVFTDNSGYFETSIKISSCFQSIWALFEPQYQAFILRMDSADAMKGITMFQYFDFLIYKIRDLLGRLQDYSDLLKNVERQQRSMSCIASIAKAIDSATRTYKFMAPFYCQMSKKKSMRILKMFQKGESDSMSGDKCEHLERRSLIHEGNINVAFNDGILTQFTFSVLRFQLFDTVLVLSKEREKNVLVHQRTLNLKDIDLQDSPPNSDPFQLDLTIGDVCFRLQCDTGRQFDLWVRFLYRQIDYAQNPKNPIRTSDLAAS
eukprot:491105_1